MTIIKRYCSLHMSHPFKSFSFCLTAYKGHFEYSCTMLDTYESDRDTTTIKILSSDYQYVTQESWLNINLPTLIISAFFVWKAQTGIISLESTLLNSEI